MKLHWLVIVAASVTSLFEAQGQSVPCCGNSGDVRFATVSLFEDARWRDIRIKQFQAAVIHQSHAAQRAGSNQVSPLARIVGGIPSGASEFPAVVAVFLDGDLVCTGALVGPNAVVTAANRSIRPMLARDTQAGRHWSCKMASTTSPG